MAISLNMTTWQDWANLKLAELEVYLRSGALDELLAQAFPYFLGLLVLGGLFFRFGLMRLFMRKADSDRYKG